MRGRGVERAVGDDLETGLERRVRPGREPQLVGGELPRDDAGAVERLFHHRVKHFLERQLAGALQVGALFAPFGDDARLVVCEQGSMSQPARIALDRMLAVS